MLVVGSHFPGLMPQRPSRALLLASHVNDFDGAQCPKKDTECLDNAHLQLQPKAMKRWINNANRKKGFYIEESLRYENILPNTCLMPDVVSRHDPQ